jgi:dUTP pyrophosphatase
MTLVAKFFKTHPDAVIPEFKTEGSVCCDLTSVEDVEMYPKQLCRINTGLVAIPPLGYHWEIYARSSLASKKSLIVANGVGIIDEDYQGPTDVIKVLVYALQFTHISKGERVAQMRLVQTIKPKIVEVTSEQLAKSSRGGFGSTG